MLRRLIIRDFVLVDRLELDFQPGFGALTGETGAGKSILVDALAFALGERADAGLIRAGAERAEVAVEFDLEGEAQALDWLGAHDLDTGEGLILRRVIDAAGRSRAYLNGSPSTLQQLREIAEFLVDIHGQHAHQSLLRSDAQRSLLDTQAGLLASVAEVASAWRAWSEARSTLQRASEDAQTLAEERERLLWQVRELESLTFSLAEWQALDVEHKRLAHAASLAEGAQYSLTALSESDTSCDVTLDAVAGRLEALVDFDPALLDIVQLLRSAQAEMGEAVSSLRRYADRAELDPGRLEEVERRIEAVLGCARKYRASPTDLPDMLNGWQCRLQELNEAADLALLQERVEKCRARYFELAHVLSARRLETATALGTAVSRVMQQLALGGAFEVGLLPLEEGGAYGLEQIEFRLAALPGTMARPLAKVASGGELSRISLAIQVVTSQAARVPTLIFDEVDVGIGGGVAEVVGRLLRELGSERQVLCVTHLPQVAARANWQWRVSKRVSGESVHSSVTILDAPARIEEIARMLGGVEVTALTREHAMEMIGLV